MKCNVCHKCNTHNICQSRQPINAKPKSAHTKKQCSSTNEIARCIPASDLNRCLKGSNPFLKYTVYFFFLEGRMVKYFCWAHQITYVSSYQTPTVQISKPNFKCLQNKYYLFKTLHFLPDRRLLPDQTPFSLNSTFHLTALFEISLNSTFKISLNSTFRDMWALNSTSYPFYSISPSNLIN